MKTKIYIFLISLILLLIPSFTSIHAQGIITEWSGPEIIFSTPDGYKSNELWVLSDKASSLYLWWPLFADEEQGDLTSSSDSRTVHTQRIGEEWRSPNDVLIWPDAGRLTSVALDKEGIFHGFSATDCVSYVAAARENAMSARGWEERVCLDQTGIANPSVVQMDDGKIFILYISLENHTLRLISSPDGGENWSSYTTVEENLEDFLLSPMIVSDNKERLHVVWSVGQAPSAYPPLGVYYSRSEDGGLNWTSPIQLGGEGEGQPAIAVYEDEVHVLWNGDAAKRGRYYRYSPDGGDSWSAVETLSPSSNQGGEGGLQRPPAIIVDNKGNVHALLHEQETLYYAYKADSRWNQKQSLYNPELLNAVELFAVRLAITGGNKLHAVYILESYDQSIDEDPRNHIFRVFHQFKEIDALKVFPTPWPTNLLGDEPDQNFNNPEEIIETDSLNPPNEIYFPENQGEFETNNPASSLFLSGIVVFIFLGMTIIYSLLRFKNRS